MSSAMPHQHAVQMHEAQNEDPAEHPTTPIQEHSSLFHETHETVRRLFQHIIFACLLTLRLYMLPLLYLSHKLTVRDDPWYFSTWNIMLRPGRSMANCTQCQGGSSGGPMLERWKNFKDNFCAPVRILRTLYALGQAIGEDPNTLQPSHPPLLMSGPDSAIDVQSVQENTSKPACSESTEATIEAPASASQIYHAAILNGNTLDNILAAFETGSPTSSVRTEHVIVGQSPDPNCDNDERLTGPFIRHRFRNSSARSKAQGTAPIQAADSTTIFSAEARHIVQHQPQTPCHNSCETYLETSMESSCSRGSALTQVQPVSSHYKHSLPSEKGEAQSTTSPEAGHCATFTRRHSHSPRCKRPLSSDSRSLAVLQEQGTMSSPTLSSSSPTKRTRLQRRVKAHKEEDRV